MSERTRAERAFSLIQWAGFALTVLWTALWAWYLSFSGASLRRILALDPIQIAEFLAGVVGPLVLLWLILGHWQQSRQIRWDIHDRTEVIRRRDILSVANLLAEADANVDQASLAIEKLLKIQREQRESVDSLRGSIDEVQGAMEGPEEQLASLVGQLVNDLNKTRDLRENMKNKIEEISNNNKAIWRNLHASALRGEPLPYTDVILAVEHKLYSEVTLRRIHDLLIESSHLATVLAERSKRLQSAETDKASPANRTEKE